MSAFILKGLDSLKHVLGACLVLRPGSLQGFDGNCE